MARAPTVLALARDGGKVIAGRVYLANSFAARLKGLIGKQSLPRGEGLYLPGTSGVHMLFMRFPIDCVFLGARGHDGSQPVLAIRQSLPPWRGVVWHVRGARDAVELPAGTTDEHGLRVGDRVRLDSVAR